MHRLYQSPPIPVQSGLRIRALVLGIYLGVELGILQARGNRLLRFRCSRANAGFWGKAQNLQPEAILRRPPHVTIRSSYHLLADLCGCIDALVPRRTLTPSGSHRRRRHFKHHSPPQSEDPILKPPQATARQGKDGVVVKQAKIEVKETPELLKIHHQVSAATVGGEITTSFTLRSSRASHQSSK